MRIIDADALKEKRFRMHSEFLGTVTVVSERDIDNAPTIDAEPVKHGRWIKHEGYDECNLCHTKTIFGHNYCPNCGAKMEVDNG